MKVKTCEECGKEFRLNITIDGKKRNLSSRRYCLECTPFGTHNTQPLKKKNEAIPKEKLCPDCNETKPASEFYMRKNQLGTYCKECNNNRSTLSQRRTKQKCVDYKGGECVICGYKKSINALQFHHLDPAQKDFTIASNKNSNFEKLKPELDKCILVCGNCHDEIHAGLYEKYKISESNIAADDHLKPIREKAAQKLCACGKAIGKNSTQCRKCVAEANIKLSDNSALSTNKIQWPSNEELQKLVWEKPSAALAKQLGVSDKAIEKRCKKRGISKPPRGYWACIEVGMSREAALAHLSKAEIASP